MVRTPRAGLPIQSIGTFRLCALAFALAAGACAPESSAPPLPQVIAIRELDAGVHVAGVAIGPNGDVWLATLNYGSGPSGVIRLRGDGTIQRFPRAESFNRVAVDPHGVAWLTVGAGSSGQQPKLVRIDGAGAIREYPLPVEGNFLGITIGPDRVPWFVDAAASEIGRRAPSGEITYYGPTSADPTEITTGSDGILWFTERSANLVGRLNPDGSLREYRVPTPAGRPTAIVADARGNVWFCESAANKIGRLTGNGKIEELAVPTADAWPAGIAPGRDGTLWFTELSAAKIGRITPGAHGRWEIIEFAMPGGGYPGPIARAPDGSLWIASNAKRDAILGLIASRSRAVHLEGSR